MHHNASTYLILSDSIPQDTGHGTQNCSLNAPPGRRSIKLSTHKMHRTDKHRNGWNNERGIEHREE